MKRNRHTPLYIGILALALCAGLMTFSGRVRAQVLDVKNIKPIPTYLGAMDNDTFVALTTLQQDIPMDDKSMSYEVRMPKAWTKNTDVSTGTLSHISDRVWGEIARYYSPSDLYTISRFTITAMQFENQISAKNWFLNYVMSNGFVLQGMKIYSDDEVEGLYVLIEKDTSYSVRTKAVINGPRMFLISYYVPYQNWAKDPQIRAMQERTIASFRFTSPEARDFDLTKDFRFLNYVQFRYPRSWNIFAPNIFSTEGMVAKVSNTPRGNVLEGEINVKIVSTESDRTISEEIRDLKSQLRSSGFKISEVMESEREYKLDPSIYFSRIEEYKAEGISDNILEHEYWVAVLVEDSYFYIVTLLTPGRLSNFYTWAINSEAFETVVQSIGPIEAYGDEGFTKGTMQQNDVSTDLTAVP